MCENCERLRGELADVRCQFSIMDSLRKTEKSRAEKAEAALAESLAREAVKDEALNLVRFGHWGGERCDPSLPIHHGYKDGNICPVCHALSQTAKAGESKI